MKCACRVIMGLLLAAHCFSQQPDSTVDYGVPRGQYLFPQEAPLSPLTQWRSIQSDSAHFAAPGYNDSLWDQSSGAGMWVQDGRERTGIVWYRTRVFLPHQIDTDERMGLYQVSAVSASQLYWDGRMIAHNGIVGTDRASEKPGVSGQIVIVPQELCGPGMHTIALRVSNFHAFSGSVEPALSIGIFSRIRAYLFLHGTALAFLAGIFFSTALFHLALLIGDRDRWPYAIFSLFCLSCAVYILIENLLKYWGVDLRLYYILAAINDIPWVLMMTLLPVFFLFEFSLPFKRRLSTVVAVVAVAVTVLARLCTMNPLGAQWLWFLDSLARWHAYATILFSCAIAAWALFQRKVGCLTSAAGLAAFLAGVFFTDRLGLDFGWAAGFAVLILFLTASLSNQMRQRNRAHQSMQLRSTRLELELLKKHIQPHFLLNSLNSIVAWLEEDPATAAKLVNALADEFRRLLRSAREPRITLSEEVRLCRSHLQVMGLRYAKQFTFKAEGVRYDEFVPPFILHTLVENGLTHGYSRKDSGTFVLSQEDTPKFRRLILFNDSEVEEPRETVEEGTGMLYVKGRLEEMYPGKWDLRSYAVNGGWQVEIDVARDAL